MGLGSEKRRRGRGRGEGHSVILRGGSQGWSHFPHALYQESAPLWILSILLPEVGDIECVVVLGFWILELILDGLRLDLNCWSILFQ
jgi:hypothetical protein